MVNSDPLPRSTSRALSTFRAFHSHNYRLLWPANFLTYIPMWIQMTMLGWMVLVLTDSPFLVALVGFFGWSPMLILGLVGGFIADTGRRKNILLATQLTNLVVSLAMIMLLMTESERFWHAYIAMILVGTSRALDMPSRRTLILDMLGRGGVANGIALDQVAMSASLAFGPALAGILIKTTGFAGGYVAIFIAYSVGLMLVWNLKIDFRKRNDLDGKGTIRDLLLGLRYVSGHRTIVAIVLITILMNLLLFSHSHMVPVIAREVLAVGPLLMGVLAAAAGFGSMVGAVIVASATKIRYPGRLFLGGSLLALIFLFLFSMSGQYLISILLLLVLGFGASGFSTTQATMVMLIADEEMRGKALGVVSLAIGAGPLGALLVGTVAYLWTPSFALGLNALVGILLIGLIGFLMPSLRRIVVPQE